MVDLPIPSVSPVLTEAPRSGVSGEIFRQPQQAGIGDGVLRIAEGVDALAAKAAEAQGREDGAQAAALAREADGTPQPINHNSFILGPAGEAYRHAHDTSALVGLQTKIGEAVNELRNEFASDPESFKHAVGKYADRIRDNYAGALGTAGFAHATHLGSQYYVAAVNDKKNADIRRAYADLSRGIDDNDAELLNIARRTVSDSPDFIENLPAWQRAIALRNSLAVNPELRDGSAAGEDKSTLAALAGRNTWTPERVNSDLLRLKQEAINSWVYGNVQRVRDSQGIDAATDWAKKKIFGANSNVPPEQRQAAFNNAVNLIHTTTQEQKARLNASRDLTAEIGRRFGEGNPPGESDLDTAIAAARRAFDVDSVMRLDAMREVFNARRSSNTLAPADQERAILGPQPAPSSGYFDVLIRKESGGNPNARASTSSAAGLAQFTAPTWARLARTYPALGLTPGGRTNPDEVARALPQFTADNQKVLANAGVPITDKNTYLAHFLGAGGAVKFIRAMSADPNASAAEIMPEAASANRALFYDRNGAARPLKDVYALATNGFSGDITGMSAAKPAAIPFTAEQVARNPYLASQSLAMIHQDERRVVEQVKSALPLIESAIKIGAAPDPASIAHVLQVADQHPAALGDVATKLRAAVAAAPLAMQIAGFPDGGAAYIEQAQQIARESPSLASLALASELKDQAAGARKAFEADHFTYAARPGVGWIDKAPAPIVDALSDPASVGASDPAQALRVAISQRRDAAYKIAGRTDQNPTEMMFTAGDVQSLARVLQRTDGAGASTVLRGLEAGLRPEEMQALAAQKDFANAVSGLARSGDPAKVGAAYGFLDKQARENPEAFKKDYGADTADKLAVWNSRIAFMDPDSAARELMRWSDPSYEKITQDIRRQAHEEIKDATPADIARKVSGDWMTHASRLPAADSDNVFASANGMLQDYRENYAALRAAGADKAAADTEATKRISAKWGPSDVNGGRVMAYPPERYYDADINGSRAYIQNQLSDAIEEAAAIYRQAGVDPQKMRAAPRALIADASTQEDIASRLPPSYRVAVLDDSGRWALLEQRAGVPLRFRADAKAAIEGQTQDYLARRRQSGLANEAFTSPANVRAGMIGMRAAGAAGG